MGAGNALIYPLDQTARLDESLAGGKAVMLGRLIEAGYQVPPGFCIAVTGYEQFVERSGLTTHIRMELGRKSFDSMRWEEIWDAALRIRNKFLAADVSPDLAEPIIRAYRQMGSPPVAVRSSAPGEDSAGRSHAGLHESIVGVDDERELLKAVRIVWASLWSDAALLYRQELGMDPRQSRMAVVIQSFVSAAPSGVGFGIDPRRPREDFQVVEAVPGPCEDLVSGLVDPDHWLISRSSGNLIEWRPGQREESEPRPLLDNGDLRRLHRTMHRLEAMFGWTPDLEWTGASDDLTLLQVRPVTGTAPPEDERAWYLSLRLGRKKLDELCRRVTGELIPALENESARLAGEPLSPLSDDRLAAAVDERLAAFRKWQKIYWDEFIPFAHGIRQLGQYYNDAVGPEDPYEFIGILQNERMIAFERNTALKKLAAAVNRRPALRRDLERLSRSNRAADRDFWRDQAGSADSDAGEFYRQLDQFMDRYMNIVYQGQSLENRPDMILRNVLEMSREKPGPETPPSVPGEVFEQRLFEAVGPEREQEARDVIRIGRLSWRLRDDDNVLMGRLENQLRRALDLAADRLQSQGRLPTGQTIPAEAAEAVAQALSEPGGGPVQLPPQPDLAAASTERQPAGGLTPRQLIGQPAAPGLASGQARIVRGTEDIAEFRRGEILVCDAIQPTMTHLVAIAAAVVERRGGMLIHGAIIARELGVPCVNGVPEATSVLVNGDLLTVDGHLGIVTVGLPEFDLERGAD